MSIGISAALTAICMLAPSLAAAASLAEKEFGIKDYFALRRVTALAMSADARYVAYTTSRLSLERDGIERRVYVQSLHDEAQPVEVAALSGATQLAWVGRTGRLA